MSITEIPDKTVTFTIHPQIDLYIKKVVYSIGIIILIKQSLMQYKKFKR
jgi:hypothetical protein